MMDISKHLTAAPTSSTSMTAQFCCKPAPHNVVAAAATPTLQQPQQQQQQTLSANAVMATKHHQLPPPPPPQFEHASVSGNSISSNSSSSLVLYVANNSTSNFTSQPHSNNTDAAANSSSFQFQQFHQHHHQQQMHHQPPAYHATTQNYQHFQTAATTFNNEFYQQQHHQQQQQQQQQIRNNNVNSNKKQNVIPTSTTTANSAYNNKVNLFQTYYHHQNLYGEDKSEIDTQYSCNISSSGAPPPPTGYIATVTAVAGGSPTGNVSSSSYFSSNSSSPSTSCMTPRSTSRCDSARSVESSCSSTDSGVEMAQLVISAASSYPSPCSTTSTTSSPATVPPNLVFVSLPTSTPCSTAPQQQQQHQSMPQPISRPTHIPHVSPHTTSIPATPPPPLAPAPTDISVPTGWRRLLVNNTIVYVSPSGVELCSRDAMRQYLVTTGTCKCGLECPLHLDRVFSFDPKVTNRAWPLTTEPSELTRLCNHKRKHLQPQQQQQQPPRSSPHRHGLHRQEQAKECLPTQQQQQQQGQLCSPQLGHTRRRRRKNHEPYDEALVSQLLAQRDRLVHQQPSVGPPPPPPPLPPPPPPIPQQHKDMPLRVSEANSYEMWLQGWDSMNQHQQLHQPPPPLPPQQMQQQQVQSQPQFPPPQQQQLRPPCMLPAVGPPSLPPPMCAQQQPPQQFRSFPMVATSNSGDLRLPPATQQQVMYGGQYMDKPFSEHLAKQQPRPPPPPYMPPYNTNFHYQQQSQQVSIANNQPPPPPTTQQPPQWNTTVQCQGIYDREVPLHRLSWDDVSKRKKTKSKRLKLNNQCPNVDVRQIPTDNKSHQQQTQHHHQQQQQHHQQNFMQPELNSGVPSFMEDPNGYLAQQTALLNSTILRQTGVNIVNQRPSTSLESPLPFSSSPSSTASNSPLSTIVPLPSNVILTKGMPRTSTPQNTVIFSQGNSVSSSYTSQPVSLPDSASECQACSMNNAAAVAALYQAAAKESLSPEENPVTSSTLTQDKASPNPDPKGPIQGGTVSTSEISSNRTDTETVPSPSSSTQQLEVQCEKCPCETEVVSNQVTTMASGHTVSSNTITSVQAGRAQTVTVTVSNLSPHSSSVNTSPTFPVSVTKSPLEMVQSVVSSIQVPPPPPVPQQQQIKLENNSNGQQIMDHNQLLKSGLPPGHILVSSNGQLIMATQPQKLMNAPHQPPVSTSASLSQMIPTMNMGQPMVQLVNTLPCNTPLLLQSGMIPQTVTVEGMGSPLQLTLTGNVLHQSQLTPDDRTIITNTDLLGNTMVHKKKGKKRKSSPQTVASMLQLHNSPMIMQNFQTIPTQQQAPLLQTLTILPNNKTQFLQFPSNTPQQQNGSQNSPQQQAQQQFSNLGGHLLTSPQNSINLIQPFNLLNGAGGFMPNFPLQQILQGGTTLVVPSLQGLQGMVTLPDGTIVSQEPNHATVQLQLQNVNGQQVLTSLQGQNMFGTQQNLIATPGMVIRAPGPQTQVISNKITTTGQMISQNGQLISPQSQFLVNGAFTQQTSLNGLMVNTGQQVTLTPHNTSPPGPQNATLRGPIQGDFIQCMNVNGQPMIIPCSNSQSTVPTSQPQQNAATLLQQNTTIVQQQTTLLANQLQQNPAVTAAAANAIVNPNFILNTNLLPKTFQDLAAPLLLQKHSVSTQTAGAQTQTIMPSSVAPAAVTSQVTTLALSSPPDTTTHSAPADTTTASPLCEPTKSSTPTADFVSSSEPDPETYAWANRTLAALTAEEEVESSTKPPETQRQGDEKRVVACKRKHSDLLVIEANAEPTQELEDAGVAK